MNIATIEAMIPSRKVIAQAPMNMSMVKMIAERAVGHPAIPEDVEELVKRQWGL